jgi:hypothetical protein
MKKESRVNKNSLGSIVIVALVLVLLAVLNPNTADFKAHLAAQASGQAAGKDAGGLVGALSKGAAAVAGGVASLAGSAFERKDYVLFSTYARGKSGPLYLGVAKLFLKLR